MKEQYKLFIDGVDSSLLLNIVKEKVGGTFERYILKQNESFEQDEI
ncbi:MAG: hypothetical protein PHT76_06175 [Anaerostipes sp.]|nr:hypothetical protein [Anaerostipes sp.]